MAQLKNNSNNNSKRRGLALIELAIVLPLLLAITFGVMEYGWMFLKANQIANAARQGARVGARPNATAATITTAVNNAMTAGSMPTSAYTITITPANPSTLLSGQQLTVRVRATYANIDLGLPLIPVPTNLTSQVTMAREGP